MYKYANYSVQIYLKCQTVVKFSNSSIPKYSALLLTKREGI